MFYSLALPRKRERVVSIPWKKMFPTIETELTIEGKKSLLTRFMASGYVLAVSPSIQNLNPVGTQGLDPRMNDKITHSFDPLIHLIQGISHPLAFLMISAGCICLMMGQKHKGMNVIKWSAVGFIAIQFIPGIMSILESIGHSIADN